MSVVESAITKSTRHHAARAFPLIAQWLANLGYRDLSPATRDSYERTVAEFVLWRDLDPADYTVWDLEAFLGTKNVASRRKHKAALSSLFRFARKRGFVPENIVELVDDVRRPSQKLIETFSEGEVERLCVADPLATILLYTGIRLNEARNLRRRDVILDPVDDETGIVKAGHLVIGSEGAKGGNERTVEFRAKVAAAIREIDTPPLDGSDYLWGNRLYDPPRRDRPISRSTFHRWWAGGPKQRGLLDRAGVRYRNVHVTRHTYATRFLQRGGRIEVLRRQLGHVSAQTTLDFYEHLTRADISADLELLET